MPADNNAVHAIQGVREDLLDGTRGPANSDVLTPGGPATVDPIITGALEHETADRQAVPSRTPAVPSPVAGQRRRTPGVRRRCWRAERLFRSRRT